MASTARAGSREPGGGRIKRRRRRRGTGETSSGPGVPPPAYIALPHKYAMQKIKNSICV